MTLHKHQTTMAETSPICIFPHLASGLPQSDPLRDILLRSQQPHLPARDHTNAQVQALLLPQQVKVETLQLQGRSSPILQTLHIIDIHPLSFIPTNLSSTLPLPRPGPADGALARSKRRILSTRGTRTTAAPGSVLTSTRAVQTRAVVPTDLDDVTPPTR